MNFGLFPTRGSLMLDVVALAMIGVTVVLLFSVYQVRVRKNFTSHRAIQLVLAIALLAVIVLFEIDMRFVSDWRSQAAKSVYFASGWVDRWLWIHLFFAVPTFLLWVMLVGLALRKMGAKFENMAHRQFHRWLGWVGTFFMLMTAVTGWIFYWVSFVA
ncbi:MAG: DUF420 domain-containing protein [Pirellulaceae bacterium]|nr:DUF420 domain-containing protein [Pirellulaceae bacterium]